LFTSFIFNYFAGRQVPGTIPGKKNAFRISPRNASHHFK